MMTKMTVVPFLALLLPFSLAPAPGNTASEVWSIDQSNSAAKTYGGTIYIWESKDLEQVNKEAVAEKVDLGAAASALCLAQTGAHPVRPHMLTMNKANTQAIVSFVASGHVLFMDAHTRQPITCIRTSVGSTGVRQVHQSFPSPDETYVAVANQNGKLYERINTDYNTNTVRPGSRRKNRPGYLHDSQRRPARCFDEGQSRSMHLVNEPALGCRRAN